MPSASSWATAGYCGHVGPFDGNSMVISPTVAQLALIYTDGSQETVINRPNLEDFSGPILESDILMANVMMPGGSCRGGAALHFDDSRLEAGCRFCRPRDHLVLIMACLCGAPLSFPGKPTRPR